MIIMRIRLLAFVALFVAALMPVGSELAAAACGPMDMAAIAPADHAGHCDDCPDPVGEGCDMPCMAQCHPLLSPGPILLDRPQPVADALLPVAARRLVPPDQGPEPPPPRTAGALVSKL